MCGIAGVVSLNQDLSNKDEQTLLNMTSALRHRGPSQQGHHATPKCIIGNARLSIIDLSHNSDLPMTNEDGTVWLTYNGEVSNFRELKKKYKLEDNHRFKGSSDTEVLIHLYEELGIDFLKELTGMFAFGLLDLRKNKVLVARDFYGINPLFYMIKNNKVYFASEIKAFFETPEFDPQFNYEALYHFFSLAYIPGNRTPFSDIHEMREGQYMEIDLESGNFNLDYHYTLKYEEGNEIPEKEATQNVRDLMIDSVRRNLISDAPLGTTLSGGIDTSAMLGIVKHLGKSKGMHTFSLKMGESSFDESHYQRIMAEYADTEHHEIEVTPDKVIENLVEHVAYLDEPTGDGAAIPSYILAKEATQYVDVLLSGEGGDEVFNAYPTIAAYQFRKYYRRFVPKLFRNLIRKIVHQLPANYEKLSFDFRAKRFTTGAELDTPDAHLYWRHVFTEAEKQTLMPTLKNMEPSEEVFRQLFYSYDYEDEINRISAIDIKHFFIDDLMVKNDRTFLAHSVEGRFPLMDRLLVDYVTKLPVRYRVKGFSKLRYIEKKAMEGLVPKEVLQRSSFGLEMPHAIWFNDKLGPFAKKYLNKEFVEKTEILNWEEVDRLWKLHVSGKHDYGRPLWCILIFLIWFDLFVYNKNYKDYWHKPPK